MCGSPEIVEGFLCRFRRGLGFPDLVVDGRKPAGGTVSALMIVEGVTPVDNDRLRLNGITETIAGQHFPLQRGEEVFAAALSKHDPTLPIDWRIPNRRHNLVKLLAV